jgi:LysR family carnitine catabolism transcriptional activator
VNIKYRQLKAFVLAARSLSFTEAANELAVTQASFSSLIKELENDLELVLFERTTRKCVLTDQGKVFYDSVNVILEQLETLYGVMREAGEGKRGILRISALPSVSQEFLPQVLAAYKKKFPGVEIILYERKNEDILSALKHKQVDVGFGSILRFDDALEQHSLYEDHLELVVPTDHPLSKHAKVEWEDVARYPLIMIGTGAAENAFLRSQLEIDIAVRVEHVLTALALVRQGMGLTTLPSSILSTLPTSDLKTIPIEDQHTSRDLGMMILNEPIRSRMLEGFIEFVLQRQYLKA